MIIKGTRSFHQKIKWPWWKVKTTKIGQLNGCLYSKDLRLPKHICILVKCGLRMELWRKDQILRLCKHSRNLTKINWGGCHKILWVVGYQKFWHDGHRCLTEWKFYANLTIYNPPIIIEKSKFPIYIVTKSFVWRARRVCCNLQFTVRSDFAGFFW